MFILKKFILLDNIAIIYALCLSYQIKEIMNMRSLYTANDSTSRVIHQQTRKKTFLLIRDEHVNGSLFTCSMLLKIFEKQRQELNMIIFIHDFYSEFCPSSND